MIEEKSHTIGSIATVLSVSEEYIFKFLGSLKRREIKTEEVICLLEDSKSQRYFKYNIYQYCEILGVTVTFLETKSCFLQFMTNSHVFHKNLIANEEFGIYFINVLLLPLLKTSSKFTDEASFEIISNVIQKCILNRNIYSFDHYLNGDSKSPVKYDLCKTFFNFFAFLYIEDIAYFRIMFNAFCKSVRNFQLIYKMIVFQLELIGFDLRICIVKVPLIEMYSLNTSLQFVKTMFDVLSHMKTDLECTLNGLLFKDLIRNCIQSIMYSTKYPNDCCYEIILHVISINPLIIEPIISEIIVYVMLADNKILKTNYEIVMIRIFEVFSKLHRIHNLVSRMIPALKDGLFKRNNFFVNVFCTSYTFKSDSDLEKRRNFKYCVEFILPNSVLKYFSRCVVNLASWQVINLLKTLLFHLDTNVVEDSYTEGDLQCIYLEILGTITCWVLSSVRAAEHTVATATVDKFLMGLQELSFILGKFGSVLVREKHFKNDILLKSFLNISFNWAECYMMLHYYAINNQNIKTAMKKDFTASNLMYFHSYLEDTEWCHIDEIINSLEEKRCNTIMQKLMIQTFRGRTIFENNTKYEITTSLVEYISKCDNLKEILTNKFVVKNILTKIPHHYLIVMSEHLVKKLVEGDLPSIKQTHVYDSKVIIKGILCVIFSRIGTLFIRKSDKIKVNKALCSKIFSDLPLEVFLCEVDQYLFKIARLLTSDKKKEFLDLKMHGEQIQEYLKLLTNLPVLFCQEKTQKLIVLLVFALHNDIYRSNLDESLGDQAESIIAGIIQHNKFTFLDLLDAKSLVKILQHFKRFDEIFGYFISYILKNEEAVEKFGSCILYITNNLNENICLKSSIIILHQLNKTKRTKVSANTKLMCLQYKVVVCKTILEVLLNKDPEDKLIEPFALVLKHFLANHENLNFFNLKDCLSKYIEFSLENVSGKNIRGSLSMFTTLLHYKSTLKLKDDLMLKMWNSIKIVALNNEVMEGYSQFIILIASVISNEEFSKMSKDLLKSTEESVGVEDYESFLKHLKTWSSMSSSNFNTTKITIMCEQIGLLLRHLIIVIKTVKYKEDVLQEVIHFEIAIIQTNHLSLTPTMLDLFLLNVAFLMRKPSNNFSVHFHLAISVMESLLKNRNALIMDRFPSYLQQYRGLFQELCRQSESQVNNNQLQIQKIADCAHHLEKLTKNMVACSKDMSRVSFYLIADILEEFESVRLYPNIKVHLNNCLYSLISVCDQHAVQYLMGVLSNASTEIFKVIFENYKKFYRFTGRV